MLLNRSNLIAATLMVITAITQAHIAFPILPNFAWAAFFLSGFYLQKRRYFVLLVAEIMLIDYLMIHTGTDRFCYTPAYLFMLPCYATLWLSARWLAHQQPAWRWNALPRSVLAVLGSSLAAEIISSGGFYFFSGRYPQPDLILFADRLWHYYPSSLAALLIWLSLAVFVDTLFTRVSKSTMAS